jgi:hypothetical protein
MNSDGRLTKMRSVLCLLIIVPAVFKVASGCASQFLPSWALWGVVIIECLAAGLCWTKWFRIAARAAIGLGAAGVTMTLIQPHSDCGCLGYVELVWWQKGAYAAALGLTGGWVLSQASE